MSNPIDELKALAETDASTALYRAEEELPFPEFLTFVGWLTAPAEDHGMDDETVYRSRGMD